MVSRAHAALSSDEGVANSRSRASDRRARFRARSYSGSLVIPWLDVNDVFPPLAAALREPNGLLAAGADLSPARLIDAYRRGIYPWYSEGQPVLWWSPDPRMVLFVDEFRMSRSLAKRVRRGEFEVRCDSAFDRVIEACAAAPREGQRGTWITSEMIAAYRRLHSLGYAHSLEAWRDGEIVGGLYGVALGNVFFGESMFTRVTDASKVCLAALVALLQHRGTALIDCQQETAHLASMGARPIARDAFAMKLGELIHSSRPPEDWRNGPLEQQ